MLLKIIINHEHILESSTICVAGEQSVCIQRKTHIHRPSNRILKADYPHFVVISYIFPHLIHKSLFSPTHSHSFSWRHLSTIFHAFIVSSHISCHWSTHLFHHLIVVVAFDWFITTYSTQQSAAPGGTMPELECTISVTKKRGGIVASYVIEDCLNWPCCSPWFRFTYEDYASFPWVWLENAWFQCCWRAKGKGRVRWGAWGTTRRSWWLCSWTLHTYWVSN